LGKEKRTAVVIRISNTVLRQNNIDEKMKIPNNNLLESNSILLNFPADLLFEIFKHFTVREREESLCLVCKLFHGIIETRLSKYMVFCVCSREVYEYNQRNKEFVSRLFTVYHEPLLKGIKVDDKITFLTKDEFLDFCKNSPLLISMRNTLLKLDGFDMDGIEELLKAARNSLNITILSLGEGTRINSNQLGEDPQKIDKRFPETCRDNLPYLKYLNLSSLTIYSTPLWDFSESSFIKFNMSRVTCQPELRIRVPCSLRGLYINYQQGMFRVKKPNSNVRILLNDCHELEEW
jgi:hypothetical protein